MAVLPNVPPIPDQDRYIFLNVTSATTVIPVTFPVFGAQEDLIVRVNYQPLPSSAWTFTSLSGTPLNQLPLPITDGIVTLLSPVASGLIEVIGNWQPRQVLQPTAPGIARREFNQTISTLIAGMREQSRILRSSIPFIQTDALGDGYYSAGGDLLSNVADPVSLQDAVNLETLNAALSSIVGSGGGANIQSWALTGTGAQSVFPIALAGVLPNNSLAFLVTANGLAVDPANYSIQVAAQTITFTQAPANGADIQVRMLAYSRAASGISTTVQAIAGTDDASYMSPLKTAQAVAQDLANFLASSPVFNSNAQGQTQAPADNSSNLATTSFVQTVIAAAVAAALATVQVTGVRQTVTAGPQTNGAPNFLPGTSPALSITSQNIGAAPASLVVSSAMGGDANGNADTVGVATANLTWAALTANATNYLYVTVGAGALVAGSTTLQPIYQWGGAPSVTNGQFTFNIAEMKGYLGNGVSAAQANVVFVGQVVTNGVGVTSSIAYSYNGLYISGLQAFPSGSVASISHNLGIGPIGYTCEWTGVNVLTNAGYSPGEEIPLNNFFQSSGNSVATADNSSALTAQAAFGSGTVNVTAKGAGSQSAVATGDWNVRAYVKRRF